MMMLRLSFAALLLAAMPHATGRPGPQADFILVDKSDRQMTLYAQGKVLKSYRIVLGGNPEGHKQQQGDSRTPEGRYTIDRKIPNSQFTRGLGISYPNAQDRARAKARGVDPGGAIVIHGSPDYIEPLYTVGGYVDWTNGCVALPTAQMREVFDMVPVGTPIEIRP
jgi:murein L,D-transpeptidase YafK